MITWPTKNELENALNNISYYSENGYTLDHYDKLYVELDHISSYILILSEEGDTEFEMSVTYKSEEEFGDFGIFIEKILTSKNLKPSSISTYLRGDYIEFTLTEDINILEVVQKYLT